MQLSKEEFLRMKETKISRQVEGQPQRSRVGYFGIKTDGGEAIVRFNYSDVDEFYKDIYTVHPVTIDGKFRKVNCINEGLGSHSCPLCESGVQLQNKFYIQLIEYTRDEAGNIVPEARIWERPTTYVQRLVNLCTEYGSLKNCVFKIKRNGAPGDLKTDYVFMFGNPTIYNEQLYPKDFSAFDGYSPLGTAILNKTAEEMVTLGGPVGQTFTPQAQPQTGNANFGPVSSAAPQPTQAWSSAASGQEFIQEQPRRAPQAMYR